MSEEQNLEGQWSGELSLLSDTRERNVIYSVLDSFRSYRRAAHFNTTHVRRKNFYALPQRHRDYLRGPSVRYLETLCQVDDAIDVNADLAEAIMAAGAAGVGLQVPDDGDPVWANTTNKLDMDKCRSTMVQLYRDWSAEGEVERAICNRPVLKDLQQFVPVTFNGPRPKILVPGAGLGRLVYEICNAGYDVQGNEISYHQLFTSSFMLNNTTSLRSIALYPFAHQFTNHLTRASQLQKVMIPDICPSQPPEITPDAPPFGEMSMATGDFVVLYSGEQYKSLFDAVVTVFFIDTAPNLIRYIETVNSCLKAGGVWSNVGPLLWHFDEARPDRKLDDDDEMMIDDEDRGIASPGSFELSQDEVTNVLADYGFEIIEFEENIGDSGYMQNPASMLQHIYRPVHWVVKKEPAKT